MARTGTNYFLAWALILVAFAAPAAGQTASLYGLTATDALAATPGVTLVQFNSNSVNSVTTVGNLTGVLAGHAVRSIDFRPATGQLYAVSTSTTAGNEAAGQLYTVNLATAALTPVGPGFILGTNNSSSVDIDFNPVTDTLRVVTAASTTNNFRVSPTTGTVVATDTTLAYVAGDPHAGFSPQAVAIAHTNNTNGAAATTLYAWDYTDDTLARVGGPNGAPSADGGALTTINAPTNILSGSDGISMDIGPGSNTLYVTHDDPFSGVMGLYTRDLTTGAEAFLGAYPAGTFVTSISVSPAPVPEPGLLIGCGLVAVGRAARRPRRA